MTDKQKYILDYLFDHKGQDYYINIRDCVGGNFDDEDEFDTTLHSLENLNLVFENEIGDTYYKLTYRNLKIKYSIPHLTLFQTETGTQLLRIEDYELFNRFNGVLAEQFNIDDYSHKQETIENLRIFTIYFSDNVNNSKLNDAVHSIEK